MIRLTDLTVSYDRHPAVHHLGGTFEAGTDTAVVGPNGAGKSTLIRTIAGLIRPEKGQVERVGCSVRQIGYLPQRSRLDREFPSTVLETVLLGDWIRSGSFGAVSKESRRRAGGLLEELGLAGFENRTLDGLSGGEFQRTLFARLAMQDARVLLLDEPFTGIDQKTLLDLTARLEVWKREGRTIIAVLHDLDYVRAHFSRTLLMSREKIAWGATGPCLQRPNIEKAWKLPRIVPDETEVCEVPETGPAA